MIRNVVVASALAVGLTAAFAAPSSAVEHEVWKVEEMPKLACKDFVKVKQAWQPGMIYWLDGYRHHGKDEVQIRRDWFEYPVEQIVTECKAKPDRLVLEVIEETWTRHHSAKN